MVLANAGLTATQKAGLLLELAHQALIQPPREAALSRLRLTDSPPPT